MHRTSNWHQNIKANVVAIYLILCAIFKPSNDAWYWHLAVTH